MVLGLNFARRHPLLTGVALAGLAAGYLTESRLDPVEWNPDPIPEMSGPLAPNQELTGAPRVLTGDGPEDVAFDAEGRLYTGLEDGRVVRTVDPVDGDTVEAETETVATLSGRPIGMAFDGEGSDAPLYVCDIGSGLHRVDVTAGTAKLIADTAGGQDIVFTDDLGIVDGTVYFSDASVHELFQDELLELGDTGRLLAYDTETGLLLVVPVTLGIVRLVRGRSSTPTGTSLGVSAVRRCVTRSGTSRAGHRLPPDDSTRSRFTRRSPLESPVSTASANPSPGPRDRRATERRSPPNPPVVVFIRPGCVEGYRCGSRPETVSRRHSNGCRSGTRRSMSSRRRWVCRRTSTTTWSRGVSSTPPSGSATTRARCSSPRPTSARRPPGFGATRRQNSRPHSLTRPVSAVAWRTCVMSR